MTSHQVFSISSHILNKFRTSGKLRYSTGVYIALSNLPFHLGALSENMILPIVIPGLQETNTYGFDHILEPSIEDTVKLGAAESLVITEQ